MPVFILHGYEHKFVIFELEIYLNLTYPTPYSEIFGFTSCRCNEIVINFLKLNYPIVSALCS
jgi:hypothetical protein